MNKQLFALLAVASVATCVHADDVSGRSFFSVRPPYQSSMPERLTLYRNRAYERCEGWGAALQIVPFGGRSTNNKDLGNYFMFHDKSELNVLADNTATDTNPATHPALRDVNPAHFGIVSTDSIFSSHFKIAPKHSFYGVGVTYQHHFGCEDRYWVEVSTPIMQVKNNVVIDEEITTAVDNPDLDVDVAAEVNTSMAEAFTGVHKLVYVNNAGDVVVSPNGIGWNYGKINGSHKKTGLADIELKLGYDTINEETCFLGGYVGLVLPTGTRPKGEYVFEPILGERRHFGFLLGIAAQFELWCGCDSTIRWVFDGNSRYLLSNRQTRSFDVKDKPWSRYMMVYANHAAAVAEAPTEGINIFTHQVNVKPRFQYNLNSGLIYNHCNFEGEIGYNFWARQAECVKLACNPWIEGPAFANLTDQGRTTTGLINRAINIGENFGGPTAPNASVNGTDAATYADLQITADDLDLDSAAHPCAMSHIIYLSGGYKFDDFCGCSFPMVLGLGGSYEFSGENTALNRFTIWGKFVVSL